MKKIKIEKFELKNFGRPFIVGEVGINHNGKIKNAIKMIEVAKRSGCDAVKFQTFKANELVNDKSIKFSYFSREKKLRDQCIKCLKDMKYKVSFGVK